MSFRQACPDVRNIIWSFCGDLRDRQHRLHKFVGTELRCWTCILGPVFSPSNLVRQYRFVGDQRLKNMLQLAYLQAERKALLKDHKIGRP